MLYAIKVLHKSKIMSRILYIIIIFNIFINFFFKKEHNLIKYALTERNVMSVTNHPFIVKLNYAF